MSIFSPLSTIFFMKHFISISQVDTGVTSYLIPPNTAPEICNSRSLGSKANALEEDENEEKILNTKVTVKMVDNGKIVDKDRIVDGKSEYSRIREANIAQNKKLLGELGLLSDLFDGTDKKTKKKGKSGMTHRYNADMLDIAR